jgi:hypothetical protein
MLNSFNNIQNRLNGKSYRRNNIDKYTIIQSNSEINESTKIQSNSEINEDINTIYYPLASKSVFTSINSFNNKQKDLNYKSFYKSYSNIPKDEIPLKRGHGNKIRYSADKKKCE